MRQQFVAHCLLLALLISGPDLLAASTAEVAAPAGSGVSTLRCGTLIDGLSSDSRRGVAIEIKDRHHRRERRPAPRSRRP